MGTFNWKTAKLAAAPMPASAIRFVSMPPFRTR
jgi:hypothetical protein